MQLKNKTLQIFVEDLIQEIKKKNERHGEADKIDLPFVVAPLWQSFSDTASAEKKYLKFINDIQKYDYWINITTDDSELDIIYIDIFLSDVDYSYTITIREEMDGRGYCTCKEGDKGYNKEEKCCGKNCDWYYPVFELHKVMPIAHGRWEGSQKKYWKFKRKLKEIYPPAGACF